MAEILAAAGNDAWVRDDHVNRNISGTNGIRLQASHRRGFIHIPLTNIRGRTVLSATLTGHVRSGFAAQTVTVHAVSSPWSVGKLTWARQPGTSGSVSTTLGSLSDGAAANLDVTSLLQSVAAGAAWRGVRLSTDAATADTSNWYSFDSGEPSWSLTVELSDVVEQPSDLRPNGGAVASGTPILAWSYTDLGGDSSEQGAFQVQIDPAADEVSPAFDTGWSSPTTVPQYTTAGDYPGLASGATTFWRVRTKDAAGNESDWSDWASWTNTAYPTLTVDSPTGGVIGDSTPEAIAHLTGETLTQWRLRVLDAAGDTLWDSGLSDGTFAINVPKRNDDGERIIKRDDATYTFQFRAWGDVDRAVAVGYPAYVEQLVNVVFDDDAGVTAPSALTVAAASFGDPRITFTWFRSLAPDGWLILKDGEVHDRLDFDEPSVSAGTYTWTDDGRADPFVSHTYTVRAVESGVRSHASNAVAYEPLVVGVWLVPDDGTAPIKFEVKSSIDSWTVTDRAAIYKPTNSDTNVRIVYGFEGAAGTFNGLLAYDQDQMAAAARLATIRRTVSARPRLVWGSSIPVQISNVKCLPAADFTAANPVYNVSFDFIQSGD